MKTTTAAIVFSLLLLSASGQNRELTFLNGFWIAEEYSNSFVKTKSALLSKDAFDPNDPVALRIEASP